jgi:hypothetical protein
MDANRVAYCVLRQVFGNDPHSLGRGKGRGCNTYIFEDEDEKEEDGKVKAHKNGCYLILDGKRVKNYSY